MESIIVGAPVFKREWVLPQWFAYVEAACRDAEIVPGYSFVGDPDNDPKTWDVIEKYTRDRILYAEFIHEDRECDDRQWDIERFERMVLLRNVQLARIAYEKPDLFLSLDSDILLHPLALMNMLETIRSGRFAVVGGLAHMATLGHHHPSFAMLNSNGGLRRWKLEEPAIFPVDVVMAIVLQDRRSYYVAWESHQQGEDIGRCINLKKAKLPIGVDARVTSKHVMTRRMLESVDNRCGY